MAQSKTIRSIAVVVLILSSAVLGVTLFPPGPSFDPAPHRALGVAAAEEILKLQAGAGGRILLIDRDPNLFHQSRAIAAHLRALHETLARSGQRIAVTNFIKTDPNRLLAAPPGEFFELLRRTKSIDVVVSFLGPPMLKAEQAQLLKGEQARVLAFCPGNVPRQSDLAQLFRLRVVQAAIVDQPHPVTKGGENEMPRATFDRLYRIVTSENAAELGATTTVQP